MGERVRRMRMVSEGVHGMVRMAGMVRVDAVRMMTAVRMVRMMVVVVARMRSQIGGSCSGRRSIRQAEEIGQILPPVLHAHRAHKWHAHLHQFHSKNKFNFNFK